MSHIFQRLSVAAIAVALIFLAAPAAQAKIICGGKAGNTCGKGQYCYQVPGSCRKRTATGACKPRPEFCTREYRPVCGCDRKTYASKCAAAAAGVSVLSEGRCRNRLTAPDRSRPGSDVTTPAGKVCGGIAGIPCGRSMYCAYAVGTCHIADRQGMCQRRPGACTREYRPVCGCDGKTYPNACTAAKAGMSLRHKGPCRARKRLRRER